MPCARNAGVIDMSKKIALIQEWSFHPVLYSIKDMLSREFPENELEIFALSRVFKQRLDIVLINLLFLFKEYGWKILLDKKKIFMFFFHTTYIYRKVKTLMPSLLKNPDEYAFVLQLGTFFDTSVPGIPHFIYTSHTVLANLLNPNFDPKDLYNPEWMKLNKEFYKNATMIFTYSENAVRSVVEQYGCPPEKVKCIYVGNNTPIIPGELNNANYRNKNILLIGTNWVNKGGPELLAAFRIVLKKHPDAQLTIVGCSPNIDVPNCHVYGYIPVDTVHTFFRNASIFCLPTKFETFGIVFVEAMAYRLPVIGPAIECIPEFIKDGKNGYLIRPGDIEGLAEHLIHLLDHPEKCKEFGAYGAEMANRLYNWENVGKLLKSHIQQALKNPRPA
jgi:glycosyltransferase involved in cell wall biosynthesis